MAGRTNWNGKAAALFVCVMAVAMASPMLRTDFLLSKGFGKALKGSSPARTFGVVDGSASQPAVGDEGYWLTRSDVESPTPFAKPLAVGDRITISGRDGREQRLEVVDLKLIGADAPSRVSAGPPQLRLLLVTCRVTGAGAKPDAAPVRFIIEADPVEPALPTPAKAL